MMSRKKVYYYFWIFIAACILGCVWEISLTYFKHGIILNRSSLIYGQFNVVYGLGALILTILLEKNKEKSNLNIFISGFFVGGIFEYLCSLIQEIVFGTVSWDYRAMPFNLNGRTNLLFCFFWGLLSIFWIKVLWPMFTKFLDKFSDKLLIYLTHILMIFMIYNISISTLASLRQEERRINLPPSNELEVYIDKKYPDNFMNKVYNNAKKRKKC